MSEIDRRDVVEALTSAAVAFAWYAMPDVVRSPRVRGVAKVALMVPTAVVAVGQIRRAAEAIRAAREEDGAALHTGDGVAELGESGPSAADRANGSATSEVTEAGSPLSADAARGDSPLAGRAALIGAAVAIVGGAAATIAGERALYRLGERLGDRGVRWPHTRIGVASALMAGGLSITTAPGAEPR